MKWAYRKRDGNKFIEDTETNKAIREVNELSSKAILDIVNEHNAMVDKAYNQGYAEGQHLMMAYSTPDYRED
jgi:hypothetical protein